MIDDPILEAFSRQLHRRPDAPLVVASRHQADVAEVDRLARAAASRLAPLTLPPGALIALAAPNGPGFLAAWLALRRAGAAVLLLDWRTPEAEKERTARTLGAAAVLRCQQAWPTGAADFTVACLAAEEGVSGEPARLAPEIAAVKLTSGSTGTPRGIATPSAALVADDAALATSMGLRDDERILVAIPMSHSYGLSSVVMPALMRGSLLVLPREGHRFDLMSVARERQATFLPTVPAYLQALVKMSQPPRYPPSLRLVITAGAPLPPAVAVRFREIYDRGVHVFYGASECGGIAYDRTGTAGERGSLGRPIEGVEVRLVPGDGERGTVTVRSAAVAAGYFPDPDPCLAGGCFRTRDLAALCDGELYLEGRVDELINVKGKKVNPREVEHVLGQLAGVEEVVTLGVPLPGHKGEMVRSFVACRPGGSVSYETLMAWCRRHLAEHKVPRSIVLVEEIPRTDRGKLDRAALHELALRARTLAAAGEGRGARRVSGA